MSSSPPLTRSDSQPESSGRDRAIKRRDRKALSCNSCRAKKLRCDRVLPTCGNCRCRPEITACVYSAAEGRNSASSAVKRPTSRGLGRDPALNKDNDRATTQPTQTGSPENRVGSIISNTPYNGHGNPLILNPGNHQSSGTAPLPPSSIATASPSATPAAGEALWVTLLGELGNVDPESTEPPPPSKNSPSSLRTNLFAASRPVPLPEILIHLPSRYICDKLVQAYFSSSEPTRCVLHKPTFLEQYEDFWQCPSRASVMWTALLFGILRIVVNAWVRVDGEPPEVQGKCADLAESFKYRAAECLTHADYAHPQECLLEAMLLHLYAEYASSRDFNAGLWVTHGMVMRACLRQGYHIDPKSVRGATPFQSEMRRRIWTYVRQSDILLSFQIGLPSMLQPEWLDGLFPGNIPDYAFSPHSDSLPTPMPDADVTSVSYLIAKATVVFGFARALNEIGRLENEEYKRVLSLDNELRRIYGRIPAKYQIAEPMSFPPDDALLVGLRLVIAGIHHKALCIIHSKFLKAAANDQQYLYSWLSCLGSAMSLLSFQAYQHQNSEIQGQYKHVARYQHSLTIHDFFLAATILYTALFLTKDRNPKDFPFFIPVAPSQSEMLSALEQSIQIFDQEPHESQEAHRASELLSALLQKAHINSPTRTGFGRERDDYPQNLTSGVSFEATQRMGAALDHAGDLATHYGNDEALAPQFLNDGQTFSDSIAEYGDWSSDLFGLDLGDPIAFVQNLNSQDNVFL